MREISFVVSTQELFTGKTFSIMVDGERSPFMLRPSAVSDLESFHDIDGTEFITEMMMKEIHNFYKLSDVEHEIFSTRIKEQLAESV
jgi:hypothetical protein